VEKNNIFHFLLNFLDINLSLVYKKIAKWRFGAKKFIQKEYKMRKVLIMTFVSVFIIFTFTSSAYAWIYANDSEGAYGGSSGGRGKTGHSSTVSTMRYLIIDGAGYFLKSHSAMLQFLQKIELTPLEGTDYKILQDIINSAIENMERAEAGYADLIALAKKTPYNQDVIEKLADFNYNEYLEQNKLHPEIFKQAAALLSSGDVTGVYLRLKSDMTAILELLYKIKWDSANGNFPALDTLWRINGEYADSLIFGQLIAQVFYKIKTT
jgi:hypothetical protein